MLLRSLEMVTKQALWLLALVIGLLLTCTVVAAQDDKVAQLAKEVSGKGWIVYASRGENGTWDLFLMRPDGSQRRNITNTPDYEEGGPRFSPDGKKLLYRRFAKGTVIHHDLWGFQGVPDDRRAGRREARADRRRKGVPLGLLVARWQADRLPGPEGGDSGDRSGDKEGHSPVAAQGHLPAALTGRPTGSGSAAWPMPG